jgi:bacterioferritin-associated ferredoxin
MFVCVCRAVSDRTVAAAIAAGARTVGELARATGAGTCCGTCLPSLAAMLDGEGRVLAERPSIVCSRPCSCCPALGRSVESAGDLALALAPPTEREPR